MKFSERRLQTDSRAGWLDGWLFMSDRYWRQQILLVEYQWWDAYLLHPHFCACIWQLWIGSSPVHFPTRFPTISCMPANVDLLLVCMPALESWLELRLRLWLSGFVPEAPKLITHVSWETIPQLASMVVCRHVLLVRNGRHQVNSSLEACLSSATNPSRHPFCIDAVSTLPAVLASWIHPSA